jgi:hypothetical protein
MGGHETKAVTYPVQPGDDVAKEFQKPPAVIVVTEQGLASYTPGREMEGSAGDLKARPSRHRSTLDHRSGHQSVRASLVTKTHLFLAGSDPGFTADPGVHRRSSPVRRSLPERLSGPE